MKISSVTTGPAARVPLEYPVDMLSSFHYYRTDAKMTELLRRFPVRLIGDSGAFSAHTQGTPVDVGEYAAWLDRWKHHMAWAASLDVIGDPAESFANWRALRRRGHLTVPTVHYGCPPTELDIYAELGVDFIGLGGMAGRATSDSGLMRWLVAMFRHARDHHPTMRFHLWGKVDGRILQALPAYSADSTSVLKYPAMGRLRLFDSGTGRHRQSWYDRRDGVGPFGHRELLARYGITPEQATRIDPSNRNLLLTVQLSSTQEWARWLRRRHPVTPPRWGHTNPNHPEEVLPIGPRIHAVES